VVVQTDSPDSSRVDTLDVIANTDQGDRETLRAVETDPASGMFVAHAALKGIYAPVTPGNGIIEIDGKTMEWETVLLEASVDMGWNAEMISMELGFPDGDGVRGMARSRSPGFSFMLYSADGRLRGTSVRQGAADRADLILVPR
jgi:hypothetical protein